ncbi:integrase core domain-containing protein [Propionimicrobium lymphophilum]|uniref:integrase core domain-containing protein n=1 Tax=Propionimicrobium lymphophilum TaxID=33012 RepID=UPI003A599479
MKSSTGTVGDSYDKAQAETVNGVYITELIYSRTWHSSGQVEWATLNWVCSWNNIRHHYSLGCSAPEEIVSSFNQHRVGELIPA